MRLSLVVSALVLLPRALQGQAATTYLERYREIERLAPNPAQVAVVQNFSLRRDAGELLLQDGKLYLFTPIGGRVVAAVFQGAGHFRFAPSLPVEQQALQRYAGDPALDVAITQAVLIFSDSTPDQLRALRFAAGEVPGGVDDQVRDVINDLKGDHEGALSPAIMAPLLNSEPTGFFLAHIKRLTGEPLLFQLDPQLSETVELYRPVGKIRWGTHWALVSRGPLSQPLSGSRHGWTLRHRLAVPHYRLDVRLTPTGSADLDFVAGATLQLAPEEAVGPWLRFGLHHKLDVDSARWSDGAGALFFKAKDDDVLWVRAPRRLVPGDSLSLSLSYHGNLIDRFTDWFFIPPSADWWPTNGQGTDDALFDITFHSPSWYPIASVGQRVDSTVQDRVKTTHWITDRRSPFATFNLGLFENMHQEKPEQPTLDVLISEDAHRLLRRQIAAEGGLILQQKHMRETVAADVTNSLKFFTALFGEPPFKHFYVTEIPYSEGVSFPGVIHLAWSTFAQTSIDGFDEFFRAHEVAHQWWGNGVQPATYRDAWLSEGLAEFSGLWYLQTLKRRNDEYFKFLDQYATNIRGARNETGPIAVGYRNATPDTPYGYQYMIYEKGAWVFNMLRILMLDLQTRKEDRFKAMLHDFYASYQGHTASTDDFQRVVERHAGIPMGWFFDQWVRGTAIPTYHVAWKNEEVEGGRYRVRLRVTQEGVPIDFQAFVLVSADLGSNRFANFRVGVTGTQAEYVSPILPAPAKNVVFNELHSVLADVKTERW